jgi:fatty acid desaturase
MPSNPSVTPPAASAQAGSDLLPGDLLTRAEIDALRAVDPLRSAFQVLHCWGTIALVWVVCALWTNPLTILLGVLVVGTRQLGLGILNHDAAHFLLFRHRGLNDWVAEWLLSRPLLGADVAGYRKVHLLHHRFTQQPNDPDLRLSRSRAAASGARCCATSRGRPRSSSTLRCCAPPSAGPASRCRSGSRRAHAASARTC